MKERKVQVFIAASLDGFIAGQDDDLSFLSLVETHGEDYGYHDFMKGIDCIVVGRKTFDWVVKETGTLPHPETETWVFSRTRGMSQGNIRFTDENPASLVKRLKTGNGKGIYCEGGSEIIHQLLQANLVDEIILSLIPVMLGNGTPLFLKNIPYQEWIPVSVRSFPSGLVQLHYRLKKNQAGKQPEG